MLQESIPVLMGYLPKMETKNRTQWVPMRLIKRAARSLLPPSNGNCTHVNWRELHATKEIYYAIADLFLLMLSFINVL